MYVLTEQNITDAVRALCYVMKDHVGFELPSQSGQLFCVDVALTDDSRAWLLNIKRCESDGDMDDFEKGVSARVWRDSLIVQRAITRVGTHGFTKVWPSEGWKP